MEAVSPATALCVLLASAGAVLFFFTRDAASKRDGDDHEPPLLPFALPLIGHLIQFLWNTENLIAKASTHYGPNTPVQLRLANRRMTILNGASNVVSLFKGSRSLSSERWLVQVLVNAFGVNTSDAPFYLADDTGIGHKPLAQSNQIPPEHRVFHLVYQSAHDGLSGERLGEIQRQFIYNFSIQLPRLEIDDGEGWTNVPDLYSLIRTMCFKASITSLLGTRIFEALPNLEEDFWEFDRHLPSLFREVPRWLAPAAHAARDKMKENLKRWHELAGEAYDLSSAETDARLWEEHFGSKLLRTRQAFFSKMPISKDTIAGDDLGLLWASNANAVPASAWMILETVQRPGLLERVRAEISPFMSSNGGLLDIDIDGLCRQPLVQSIYAEVLRVHNGNVIARVPQKPDFSIAGWKFPKDQPIMVSSFNTARATSIWSQGTPDDPHPVDEFWPERFIVDPKDAASGPVLPHVRSGQSSGDERAEPYFSLDGTTGSWLPYGAGPRMCPGRHFAKKEMIAAMAMFLTVFDVELMPRDGWIQHDMHYFMFGVMQPKGEIRAKVRRRRLA